MAEDPIVAAGTEEQTGVGSAAPSSSAEPQTRASKIAAFRATSAKPTPSQPEAPAAAIGSSVAPTPEAKPESADPAPDEKTAKALEAIEKRDKRAREQLAADQAAWKQQRDLELAELQKLKAELTGKAAPSLDELKKLPPARRYIEAMRMAGLDPDDEEAMEPIARDAYARSKSGKADPKNRAYADQLAEKQGITSEIATLRKELEELRQSATQRDQKAEAERFQQQYLDEAVKAVPKDPSFIGRALSANPARARAELLALGQAMEREAMEADGGRYDPSHTPSHAQVIARYEELARADLRDRGFSDEQIAQVLSPAPAPKSAPPRTLDITARPTTPTNHAPQSRAERIAAARVGLQKLSAT